MTQLVYLKYKDGSKHFTLALIVSPLNEIIEIKKERKIQGIFFTFDRRINYRMINAPHENAQNRLICTK